MLLAVFCLLYRFSFSKEGVPRTGARKWLPPVKTWYQAQAADFLVQLQVLQRLHNSSVSLAGFTRQFRLVRRSFKKMEGLVAYFDERPYRQLNSRLLPELELEKGTYEYVAAPHGLQVIESLLEDSAGFVQARQAIGAEIRQATRIAVFLKQNPLTKPYTDTALAEAVGRQLLRIAAMGMTGFDKPVLEDALPECAAALEGMQGMLATFRTSDPLVLTLQTRLAAAAGFIRESKADFGRFDRLTFLRQYLQPAFAASQQWKASFVSFPRPVYTSFFEKGYIDQLYHYQPDAYPAAMIRLGKALFNSKLLSQNQQISCATCHQEGLAFADTVKLHSGFEQTALLERNTPSLLNAAYHLHFQRDGHLLFLQDQFREVIFSHSEMGITDEGLLLYRIRHQDSLYQALTRVFPEAKNSLTIDLPLQALEAYVHSLVNTESLFDEYMNGKATAVSAMVQQGFNLFMGRARCGTCHFMPVFNGVQPPFFVKEDNEIIGVLQNDDFSHPVPDQDPGLYHFTQNELHRFSFKIPTVRHLAKTYPYMHNGSLKDLDRLLLFYNLGGGAGWMMGAEVPGQTLSRQPLQLDQADRDAIKAFLLALE